VSTRTDRQTDLVADILDMNRGCWLSFQQIRAEAEAARRRQGLEPPPWEPLARGCQLIQSASSVQRRLVEGVRWWQDGWRPQWIVELRVTWPTREE